MINSLLKTAIIIQVNCPSLISYDINEMKGLAKTAGYNVCNIISQKLDHINPKFFLGRGKVELINSGIENFFNNFHRFHSLLNSEELEEFNEENSNPFKEYENQDDNIEFEFPETVHKRKDITIIFNNRLGNMHRLNLSKVWDLKVIDRDELVLEIFEKHAQTHESKLQIELARLNLETNIIKKELGQHLEEKQGRDFKGKGRKGWEPKMRAFRGRKKKIRDELQIISKRRNLRRKARTKFFNVGLIGYTNAGKSTILNKLSKSRFETAQQEFTTVSPVSRKVVFPFFKENGDWNGQEIILTDSVGFIMDMSP
ncbi:MAG: GTPase, partial [Promethearchaeota archaeon]